MIKWLLEQGIDVDEKDAQGYTPLIYAAKYNRRGSGNILLKYKANLNQADDQGYTPVVHAALCEAFHVFDLLVAWGADLNIQDHDGHFPLLILGRSWGNLDANEKYLRNAGMVGNQDVHMLETLIQAGNPVDCVSLTGISRTPLMYALMYTIDHQNIDIVELFLEKGSDPNYQDDQGRTPLMYVLIYTKGYKAEKLTKMLLKKGARLDCVDDEGWSIYKYHAFYNHTLSFTEIVREIQGKSLKSQWRYVLMAKR